MNDSKVPYILAASAMGGAVGYLFFTKQGHRVRDSVFNRETTAIIPGKIEGARRFIERRGDEVSDKLRVVVDRVKGSMEEGKRTYRQGSEHLTRRMDRIGQTSNQVVSNIHLAIDNLNKTLHTVEHKVLEPIYEAASIAQGVQSGVKKLVERQR